MKALSLQTPSIPPTAGALFFTYCVRAWVFVVIFLMLLAFTGLFHIVLVAGAIITAVALCTRKYKKYAPPKSTKTILLVLLCVALILSIFISPNALTGRDQGTLAYAAVALAQQGSLSFTTEESAVFFDLYGPGAALNFPGFDYLANGALQAHFPAPYIVWLGAFYVLFGMLGFVIAHTILLFFFLYAFSLLLRMIASERAALVGIIFITTSFPVLWIYKTTLSENFALALLWSTITLCVFYYHTLTQNIELTSAPLRKERAVFYTLLAATALLALTRIEGLVFASLILLLLLATKKSRRFIMRLARVKLFAFLGILSAFVGYSIYMSYPFYKSVAKALLNNTTAESLTTSHTLQDSLLYNLSTLALYGMLPFLLCGIAGSAWLVYKRNWHALIPLMITGVIIYYLFNAHISSDHPWMLRRYTFALIPLGVLYSTLFFFLWKRTVHSTLHLLSPLIPFFIWAIVLYNVNITAPLLSYTDHKDLTQDLALLVEHIGERDLVLVDRNASSDPWALLSGPLRVQYNRHAVYLFDPADIDRIDHADFDRILLLTPRENFSFYADALGEERFQYVAKYTLSTNYLERLGRNDAQILPKKKYTLTRGALYEIHYNADDSEK